MDELLQTSSFQPSMPAVAQPMPSNYLPNAQPAIYGLWQFQFRAKVMQVLRSVRSCSSGVSGSLLPSAGA